MGAFNGKKYMVEKSYGNGNWSYVGEYDASFEIAQAIGHSPAKTNNFLKEMSKIGWNTIKSNNGSFYRIAKVN